ncbi:MAG: hypothetical protein IJ191_05515 [Treponema sp.]|nr:hypothetical protein [Treponema sp.]
MATETSCQQQVAGGGSMSAARRTAASTAAGAARRVNQARAVMRAALPVVISGLVLFGGALRLYCAEDVAPLPVAPVPPVMPSIVAPTFGGSFYVPGNSVPTAPIAPTAPNVPRDARSGASGERLPLRDHDRPTASQVRSITAHDLFDMDGNRLLAGMADMLSRRAGAPDMSASAFLGDILSRLADVKYASDTAVASTVQESPRETSIEQPARATAERVSPSMLRFVVNGYDVRATCRTVYFSEQGTDGTFLLTGDRRYLSDGTVRTETFYLLFLTAGDAGFAVDYLVEPFVVQDYTNEHSFLYQLAQRKELRAQKTGNLVALHVTEPSWTMDLLIDMHPTYGN